MSVTFKMMYQVNLVVVIGTYVAVWQVIFCAAR